MKKIIILLFCVCPIFVFSQSLSIKEVKYPLNTICEGTNEWVEVVVEDTTNYSVLWSPSELFENETLQKTKLSNINFDKIYNAKVEVFNDKDTIEQTFKLVFAKKTVNIYNLVSNTLLYNEPLTLNYVKGASLISKCDINYGDGIKEELNFTKERENIYHYYNLNKDTNFVVSYNLMGSSGCVSDLITNKITLKSKPTDCNNNWKVTSTQIIPLSLNANLKGNRTIMSLFANKDYIYATTENTIIRIPNGQLVPDLLTPSNNKYYTGLNTNVYKIDQDTKTVNDIATKKIDMPTTSMLSKFVACNNLIAIISSNPQKLFIYDNTTTNDISESFGSDVVFNDIYFKNADTLLVATNNGLFYYNVASKIKKVIDLEINSKKYGKYNLSDYSIKNVTFRDSLIYISGTTDKSNLPSACIWKYNVNKNVTTEIFNKKYENIFKNIFKLYVDKYNNLWIGSYYLLKYDVNKDWTFFGDEVFEFKFIAEDNLDRLWVSTVKGLYYVDDITTIYPQPKLDIIFPISACENDIILVKNNVILKAGYIKKAYYDFGDGTKQDTLKFAEDSIEFKKYIEYHTFATCGIKCIKLYIESNHGCKDSIFICPIIKPKPKVDLSTNYCEFEDILLIDKSFLYKKSDSIWIKNTGIKIFCGEDSIFYKKFTRQNPAIDSFNIERKTNPRIVNCENDLKIVAYVTAKNGCCNSDTFALKKYPAPQISFYETRCKSFPTTYTFDIDTNKTKNFDATKIIDFTINIENPDIVKKHNDTIISIFETFKNKNFNKKMYPLAYNPSDYYDYFFITKFKGGCIDTSDRKKIEFIDILKTSNLILVTDISQSFKAKQKRILKNTMYGWANSLKPEDKVSLLYGTKKKQIFKPNVEPTSLSREINKMHRCKGAGATWDDIEVSILNLYTRIYTKEINILDDYNNRILIATDGGIIPKNLYVVKNFEKIEVNIEYYKLVATYKKTSVKGEEDSIIVYKKKLVKLTDNLIGDSAIIVIDKNKDKDLTKTYLEANDIRTIICNNKIYSSDSVQSLNVKIYLKDPSDTTNVLKKYDSDIKYYFKYFAYKGWHVSALIYKEGNSVKLDTAYTNAGNGGFYNIGKKNLKLFTQEFGKDSIFIYKFNFPGVNFPGVYFLGVYIPINTVFNIKNIQPQECIVKNINILRVQKSIYTKTIFSDSKKYHIAGVYINSNLFVNKFILPNYDDTIFIKADKDKEEYYNILKIKDLTETNHFLTFTLTPFYHFNIALFGTRTRFYADFGLNLATLYIIKTKSTGTYTTKGAYDKYGSFEHLFHDIDRYGFVTNRILVKKNPVTFKISNNIDFSHINNIPFFLSLGIMIPVSPATITCKYVRVGAFYSNSYGFKTKDLKIDTYHLLETVDGNYNSILSSQNIKSISSFGFFIDITFGEVKGKVNKKHKKHKK